MTSEPGIRSEVKAFLRDKIWSHEHLETLLLLHAQRAESFSVQAVSEALRVPRSAAAEALDHLRAGNLLVVHGAETLVFRYGPASEGLARLVDQLAEAYQLHPSEIMQVLNTNAINRVRADIRQLADAFLIRPKKKNDG